MAPPLKNTNVEAQTRICGGCKVEKSFSEFHKNRKEKYGIIHKCKECQPKVMMKALYGITYEVYEKMLEAQNGVCAICKRAETATSHGTVRSLAVDHCHESGMVRGLLCHRCNVALGLFGEDINLLNDAVTYLKEEN